MTKHDLDRNDACIYKFCHGTSLLVSDNIFIITQSVVDGRVVVFIVTFGILLGLLVYKTVVVIDVAFILKHRNTPLLH